MDTYNYSPNGIDYDPDLLYGGPADAAPRRKQRPPRDGERVASSSRGDQRNASRDSYEDSRREPATRARRRSACDTVAQREEISERDRQRKTARASENAPRRCAARKSRQRKPPSEE